MAQHRLRRREGHPSDAVSGGRDERTDALVSLSFLAQLAQLRVGMIGQLVAAARMDHGLSELRMSDLGM
jgi:hypothetical protein